VEGGGGGGDWIVKGEKQEEEIATYLLLFKVIAEMQISRSNRVSGVLVSPKFYRTKMPRAIKSLSRWSSRSK